MDDIDDKLPEHLDPTLHRQFARQYDDEAALFGEHDPSSVTHPLQLDDEPTGTFAASSHPSQSIATQSAHRYSLPSTYPSSIASSWSRPQRSVWFQSKAIIITSIFLAIFIVLFIGAAVFLRERKFDDELEGLDDEEALARIEERMTMGRFSDPTEKNSDGPGTHFKRKFRIGRKRSEKEDLSEPSTGSSSAIKRRRHIVSRWTRNSLRDSNDTMRNTGDTGSVRSGRSARSARRLALGDPRVQESVEITYDSEAAEVSHAIRDAGDDANNARDTGTSYGSHASDPLTNRPRSPPPPHPESGVQQSSDPQGRTSSNPDSNGNSMVDPDASARSPRRVLLDDSDFQAAEAAETQQEDMRHMPPAYIPSGSGGIAAPSDDGAVALAAALTRGDAKHGIPPPEERDSSVPHEVINAVLSEAPAASRDTYGQAGPTAAHIATDDKAVLGALSAAVSMPSAPGVEREISAPAYGAPSGSTGSAGGSASTVAGESGPSLPSAPVFEVDGEGFEVATEAATANIGEPQQSFVAEKPSGKGKAKQMQAASSLLPAPPTAVTPAFSPFDQPYRDACPPGSVVPSSPPTQLSARKSEKQKEAEQEQQLAELVASTPFDSEAVDVPRYERTETASAPLLNEAEAENEEAITATQDNQAGEPARLPAYEQGRIPPPAAGALGGSSQASASAPAAPSAPPMGADEG